MPDNASTARQPREETSGDAKPRTSARALTSARKQVIDTLKEDHKKVKQAFEQFEKLDIQKDLQKAQQIVQQVCMELQMHTQLEEEVLYPAAREALDEAQMLEEAEIEHQSAKELIQKLQQMEPDADPDRYAAMFTVLCEYVMHHVKEEEHEMFPELGRAEVDWMMVSEQFMQRREALMGEMGLEEDAKPVKQPTHSGSRSRH